MGLEFINDHVLSINRQTRTVILEKQGKASFDILVVAAGPWTANLLPDIKES
jgi:NADH dehydrogenase FAD-containing subunit